MSKPVSTTPLRDEFEKLWKNNPVTNDDKETAFGMFMAGIYVMLFIVPAKAGNLVESCAFVKTAQEEVIAYGKFRQRMQAEQN